MTRRDTGNQVDLPLAGVLCSLWGNGCYFSDA